MGNLRIANHVRLGGISAQPGTKAQPDSPHSPQPTAHSQEAPLKRTAEALPTTSKLSGTAA